MICLLLGSLAGISYVQVSFCSCLGAFSSGLLSRLDQDFQLPTASSRVYSLLPYSPLLPQLSGKPVLPPFGPSSCYIIVLHSATLNLYFNSQTRSNVAVNTFNTLVSNIYGLRLTTSHINSRGLSIDAIFLCELHDFCFERTLEYISGRKWSIINQRQHV